MKRQGPVSSRWLAAVTLTVIVLTSFTIVSAAETYPSKPIRFIIPLAPGGYGDVTSRVVAQKMSASLGQQVVIENRPSAGMIVSTMAVMQLPPDGYAMALMGSGSALSVTLFKSLPFNILTDFTQVSVMASVDLVLLVDAHSKFASLADVLAFGKRNAGKLNLATSYIGSTQHLAAEVFKKQTGIDALVVTYKSPPDVLKSLRSGTVDLAFDFLPPALAQIQSKALRVLAIAAPKRFPGLPDTPTTKEAGLPDYEVKSWNSVSVRAGTPRPIIDRLNKEVVAALNSPDVKQRMQSLGLNPLSSTPEETRALMVETIAQWKKVIEEANIPRQ